MQKFLSKSRILISLLLFFVALVESDGEEIAIIKGTCVWRIHDANGEPTKTQEYEFTVWIGGGGSRVSIVPAAGSDNFRETAGSDSLDSYLFRAPWPDDSADPSKLEAAWVSLGEFPLHASCPTQVAWLGFVFPERSRSKELVEFFDLYCASYVSTHDAATQVNYGTKGEPRKMVGLVRGLGSPLDPSSVPPKPVPPPFEDGFAVWELDLSGGPGIGENRVEFRQYFPRTSKGESKSELKLIRSATYSIGKVTNSEIASVADYLPDLPKKLVKVHDGRIGEGSRRGNLAGYGITNAIWKQRDDPAVASAVHSFHLTRVSNPPLTRTNWGFLILLGTVTVVPIFLSWMKGKHSQQKQKPLQKP